MIDFQGKPKVWAQQCISCHVLPNDATGAALRNRAIGAATTSTCR